MKNPKPYVSMNFYQFIEIRERELTHQIAAIKYEIEHRNAELELVKKQLEEMNASR